tara:strand:+ start:415 stop:561 length:147 start_codon:yes stop_codon:yes gene_type:complete
MKDVAWLALMFGGRYIVITLYLSSMPPSRPSKTEKKKNYDNLDHIYNN